ncbi:MAG: asparagine synthase (glutamine-hydrolyzing) [Acidobacteriota bacterium]
MCGIAGLLEPGRSAETWDPMLEELHTCLAHRGPDNAGVWSDAEAGIGLVHRRLSILDLSPLGHQPKPSASGRWILSFNGEVYNFRTLRPELEAAGHQFPGTSDTEVLLAAVEEWGVEESLRRMEGMYAIILWDRQERELWLARDRMGEKPLYYGRVDSSSRAAGAWLFSSELKAFHRHPGFRAEVQRDALALLLRFAYIPAPYSIYRGVWKLPPGSVLRLSAEQLETLPTEPTLEPPVSPVAYWSVRDVAEEGIRNRRDLSEAEALAELESRLSHSVTQCMVSDVPLGAFLSGGIDSSTIVALMQEASRRPVRTFSIGFHSEAFDEAPFARQIAEHLGTDHTELYVTPREAREVIPQLPRLYDEPFSDPSQIPTHLVSRMAREHVTVALSGDGGDELFGGYKRYFLMRRLWRRVGALPYPARRAAAAALAATPVRLLDRTLGWLGPSLARWGTSRSVGDKLHKLAEIATARQPEEIYLRLVSDWKDPAAVVLGAKEPLHALSDPDRRADLPSLEERMMYFDQIAYLPDDILAKVDRAAMAVALETRIPLLQPDVVRFAWSLPLSLKIRGGEGKHLLRQLLYRRVPKEMMDRPKMGFGVPIGDWLRDELRDWAEDLLSEDRLRREGFLDPTLIRARWDEHLAGQRNWQYYLWDVLIFQQWWEEWGR